MATGGSPGIIRDPPFPRASSGHGSGGDVLVSYVLPIVGATGSIGMSAVRVVWSSVTANGQSCEIGGRRGVARVYVRTGSEDAGVYLYFRAVILASVLACVVTTIGIVVISRCEEWGKEHSTYFMSFAAGMLIPVSFMHVIPKSFQMSSASPVFLAVGFLTVYLSNRFLSLYICHEYGCENNAAGIIPMIGIGFHSLIDGMIYSVTFNVSRFTEVLATVGMIPHGFPEGIVTFVLSGRGGLTRRKSAIYASLVAAVSTPLGTLVS